MSGIGVFLNTKVVNDAGTLSNAGNALLTPVRYLFNGANVVMRKNKEREIHHVASFHKKGIEHVSRTDPLFTSAPKGMLRTAAAIVCLIPGLILGSLLKGIGYVSEPLAKTAHKFAKLHFTPKSYEIGAETPIRTEAELEGMCEKIRLENTLNQPIKTIHIRVREGLNIRKDPGLLELNPMKIILEGGHLQFSVGSPNLLSSKISLSKKWKEDTRAETVANALSKSADRRAWYSCKRYHTFYRVPLLRT